MMPMFRTINDTLPASCSAVEIGVYKGAFSKRFLKHMKPSHLILIDPWQAISSDTHKNAWYHKDSGKDMEAIYNTLRTELAAETSSGRVKIMRESSESAMSKG